jgi:glyoxylase-like metal-dependent hydrolase (beta-lactamase superfamily II)
LYKLNSEVSEIDGVFRFQIDFPTSFGLKFVCMYLFNIEDKYILIDAGLNFPDWEKIFLSELQKLNLSIRDIDYLIITHEHPDHLGLMNSLKSKNPVLQILMHEITYESIKWMRDTDNINEKNIRAEEMSKQMIMYGVSQKQGERIMQFLTTMRNFTQFQEPDRILLDNEEISINNTKLKTIWTPGHSLGHICIFNESTSHLFAGDHILSRITPHIGSFMVPVDISANYQNYDFNNILNHYLKSLDRIDKLDPKIIFPAHQEVVYNSHERILEMKAHHQSRLNEISRLIKNNPLTPFKISQIHFGDDLDEINTFLGLGEILSHLIYLENQEKIKRIEKNNKIYFLKS